MNNFEALVGHVHIVGGRALVSAPPGALSEVAPQSASRGRENDTFLGLALPGEGFVAPPVFYEQLIQMASELYFYAQGSGVTAGLRALFETLNRDLYDHNLASGLRYEVHLICAVLRHSELILARIGRALAIHQHGEQSARFPADFDNPLEMKRVPLGAHPVADLRMTRFPAAEGARVLLGGEGMARLSAQALRAALVKPDLSDTLYTLQQARIAQLSIIGCEFVKPEKDALSDIPRQRSSLTAEPVIPEETSTDLPFEQPARHSLALVLRGLAAGFRFGGAAAAQVLGQPQTADSRWLNFSTTAFAVVVVPVVVVLLVFLLWFSGSNRNALEICLEDAGQIHEVAQRVDISDSRAWRTAWQALLDSVAACEPIALNDESLAYYRAQAQENLDVMNYVTRHELHLLTKLPNAQLKGIVLRNRNLFVLDDQANTQVYHMTLADDGLSIIEGPEPLPYLRGNASLDGQTLGRLIDIDWSDEAMGFGNENVIVGLDEEGHLVDCLLAFLSQCQVQNLQRADQWHEPLAMHIWDGRLYILDPPRFQIWRYEPSGGAYHDVPTEYFTGQGLPNIDEAVDFSITATGDLFIQRSDGLPQKYRGGIEQSFGLLAFPRMLDSADGLFIDESSLDSAIYIADSESRSIIKMSLGGSFIAEFRLTQESALAELQDLVVDSRLGLIYAIAGNAIYVLSSS